MTDFFSRLEAEKTTPQRKCVKLEIHSEKVQGRLFIIIGEIFEDYIAHGFLSTYCKNTKLHCLETILST